ESEMLNHVAAIESDMGAGHPLGFNVKISANALPALKPVQDVLRTFGANLIKTTNYSPGSDIAPLAQKGVPTLGIMQDSRTYFNYHHTAADTLDKIVPQELRENAATMAVMGYALANLPEPLPREAHLSWQGGPGSAAPVEAARVEGMGHGIDDEERALRQVVEV